MTDFANFLSSSIKSTFLVYFLMKTTTQTTLKSLVKQNAARWPDEIKTRKREIYPELGLSASEIDLSVFLLTVKAMNSS